MKPILFQSDMILANLAHTKGQTRRLPRVQPHPAFIPHIAGDKAFHNSPEPLPFGQPTLFKCRHGAPEDELWVKETFFPVHLWKTAPLFAVVVPDYFYRADWLYREGQPGRPSIIGRHHWTPAIFMPRAASRITLRLTAIRCERLQQITPADALAEGVSDIAAYRRLWNGINLPPKPIHLRDPATGKRAIACYASYPWSLHDFEQAFPHATLAGPAGDIPKTFRGLPLTIIPNPWLWVLSYQVITPPPAHV
jgi:hypothetical protein